MSNKKFLMLIASLMVAIGPWFIGLSTFNEAFTPQGIGAVFGIVGGVLLAWLGESPLKPKL